MTYPKTLRVGTRKSLLATTQTNWLIATLKKAHPTIRVETVEIVTKGDRILDLTLSKVPGKGLFVKEIEDRLLSGEIDLAVHSMKDLPTELPDGLRIGATSIRENVCDVLVSRHNQNLQELPAGVKIGTSSLRRKVQVLAARPDCKIVDIRGNIDTRLKKSETDDYDGILLAAAGLHRMGWKNRIQQYLDTDIMIPAVGQGALGVEIREDDEQTQKLIAVLNDEMTGKCVQAERIFLKEMGGGCQTPIGAHCTIASGVARFSAFASEESGEKAQRLSFQGDLLKADEFAYEAASRLSHLATIHQYA